jgi:selenocysteine lyase/cysteine desulfurase
MNNAGAALPPRPVHEAIVGHLEREARLGGYEAAEAASEDVQAAYEAIARLIGAAARNVAVVENATVAVAQALSAFDFRPGDRLVTSRCDYPSNQLMYLSLARRFGLEIVRAEDLPEGGVDPESVRRLAGDGRCRLVSISWVPTNSGLVQAAEEVGAVCAELGVPYLVDACQAVGQLEVDVARLRCDFLAATARKFLRGPRGIGFLYVSDERLAAGAYPLYLDMRGAEWTGGDAFRLYDGARRFENWEFPYALVLGLGAAARYALEAGEPARRRAVLLGAELRGRLSNVPRLRVLDRGRLRCAIVTADAEGVSGDELKERLRGYGINAHASTLEDGVLDMEAKRTASVLRLSPHYYNTSDEIGKTVGALREILAGR